MEICNITIFSLFLPLYMQNPPAPEGAGDAKLQNRSGFAVFFFDGPVDGLGGFLAGAHGQNDGGRTGDGVTARIDEGAGW